MHGSCACSARWHWTISRELTNRFDHVLAYLQDVKYEMCPEGRFPQDPPVRLPLHKSLHPGKHQKHMSFVLCFRVLGVPGRQTSAGLQSRAPPVQTPPPQQPLRPPLLRSGQYPAHASSTPSSPSPGVHVRCQAACQPPPGPPTCRWPLSQHSVQHSGCHSRARRNIQRMQAPDHDLDSWMFCPLRAHAQPLSGNGQPTN